MSAEEKVTEMFNLISPTYDKVNSILSLGMDKHWRKQIVKYIPKKEKASLLDIATGTGEVILEAFKQNRIEMAVGIDLAEEMLKLAESKFQTTPYKPLVNFIQANALSLPFEDSMFDAVSISYGIRNVQDTHKALSEMHRVLKKEGRALILEFSLPKNALLKKMHLLYLRKFLPKIGQFFSKSKSSYVYLNETIESFPYGDSFTSLMKTAGFSTAKAVPILGGVTTLYVGEK